MDAPLLRGPGSPPRETIHERYRSFDDSDVERAIRIASLIRSGLPSKLVRVVLAAHDEPASWGPPATSSSRTCCASNSTRSMRRWPASREAEPPSRPNLRSATVNNVMAATR